MPFFHFAKERVTSEEDNFINCKYRVSVNGEDIGSVYKYHSRDWGWSTSTIDDVTVSSRDYAARKLLATVRPDITPPPAVWGRRT